MKCIVVPETSTSPEDGWGNICPGRYVLSEAKILQSTNRIESTVLADPALGTLYRESKAENGVTIFIPNWNHRPYLPRSIRSALRGDRSPQGGRLLWRAPGHRRCLPRRFAEILADGPGSLRGRAAENGVLGAEPRSAKTAQPGDADVALPARLHVGRRQRARCRQLATVLAKRRRDRRCVGARTPDRQARRKDDRN